MKHYVAGFAFDECEQTVLLIQKHKPDWQRGMWNAVGGKVEEGETPLAAMEREFLEETGAAAQWDLFAVLTDARGWTVHFFSGFGAGAAESQEAERVVWHLVEGLPPNIVPNLAWLVPMARRVHRLSWPLTIQEAPR